MKTYISIVLLISQFHLIMSANTTKQRRRHVAADGSVREYNQDLKKWIFIQQETEQKTDAPQLAIEGRRFEYNFAQGEFEINNTPIYILPPENVRDSTIQTDGDTGRTVWDAAVVIAKYMETKQNEIQGKRILELGAGTGLAGLAAAALGGNVDISDLDYCLPLIINNIQHTTLRSESGGSAAVRELDWTNTNFEATKDTYDIILGADIVWLEHLVAPLVDVMNELLAINSNLKIILAHQTRSAATDEILFDLLDKKFVVQSVKKPEGYKDTRVNLFELYGKE